MKKQFSGKVWKLGDDIDTDIIIPTQFLALESVEAMKKYAFHPLRPELAGMIAPGDIIVAGKNFGCGSSREHAPVAIKASGVTCVIAGSFARIFYRNAINIGLPLIELGDEVEQIKAGHVLRVDLVEGKLENRTTGQTFTIQPLPGFIREIAQAGGLVNYVKGENK